MLKCSIARVLITATCIIFATALSHVCYAGVISIPCSKSDKEAKWHVTKGKLGTKMTLTTVGIMVKGEEKPVLNWGLRDGRVQVDAKCIDGGGDGKGMDGVGSTAMMYSEPDDDFVPDKMPSLECPEGKSLAVIMYDPTDDDPDTYVYKGILTETTD